MRYGKLNAISVGELPPPPSPTNLVDPHNRISNLLSMVHKIYKKCCIYFCLSLSMVYGLQGNFLIVSGQCCGIEQVTRSYLHYEMFPKSSRIVVWPILE